MLGSAPDTTRMQSAEVIVPPRPPHHICWLAPLLALILHVPAMAQRDRPRDLPVASPAQVRALAGSQVRAVWQQFGKTLVFYDTDARPTTVERTYPFNVSRPIITPDGRDVVFIDYDRWASFIVDWRGRTARKLVDGRVTHVRRDDKGVQWIYFQTQSNAIRMARLDDPDNATTVWQFDWKPREGKSTNWQTSADGKRVAATFPWPNIGIATLPRSGDEAFHHMGIGCWPQIARDNSYRVMHCFGGDHRNLAMFDASATRGWMVPVTPRSPRHGVECPRWANDPRFFICTDRPAEKTSVYLARFNDDFTQVDRWLVLTDQGSNNEADIWVAAAAARAPAPARAEDDKPVREIARLAKDAWPGDVPGLHWLWRHVTAPNRFTDAQQRTQQSVASLHGLARPGAYGSADLAGGTLDAEAIDKSLTAAVKERHAFSMELTLTPAELPTDRRCLFAFGPNARELNIAIWQQADTLILSRRGLPDVSLGKVRAERTAHLLVSMDAKRDLVWINGEAVAMPARRGWSPALWRDGQVRFGQQLDGSADWVGRVEGIVLAAGTIDDTGARRRFEAYNLERVRRMRIRTHEVTARLTAVSTVPQARDLGPYPRALVVHSYRLVGEQPGMPGTFHVAHWAWLDGSGIELPEEVGSVHRLQVEAFDDHPHLASELIRNDLDDLDAKLYLDAGVPKARPTPQR